MAVESSEGERRPRPWLVPAILFVAACALIFPNLGDRHLWQDEAETALIAKNIMRTGLPLGWDGRIFATQLSGWEMTESYLWAWTPWLMHYVAALGMALAGPTAFGARWPFALAGCLTLPLFYAVIIRVARDRSLAIVASALLLGSVQYLLFSRQCRYYSLLPVAFLFALWGYDALPARKGVAVLSLSLLALFHGNSMSGAIAASGFGLHALLFRREAAILKRLAVAAVILVAGSAPWLVATGFLERAPAGRPFAGFPGRLLGTLLMSNRYLCPWLLLGGLGVAAAVKRLRLQPIDTISLCMFAPMCGFLPMYLWPNPRYVSFLLIAGALLAARAILELHKVSRWLGYALGAVLIFTNLLVIPLPALVPTSVGRDWSGDFETGADALRLGALRSEIAGYAYELTHASRGPDEALASFIEANTAPDDLIFMTNDWLSAMFHTGRRFAGVVQPSMRERFPQLPSYVWDPSQARWFILRDSADAGPIDAYRPQFVAELHRAGFAVERSYDLGGDEPKCINREILAKHVFRPTGDRSHGIEVWQLSRREP